MNSNDIEPHEILYRGITINPDMWKPSKGRPSSAAFKQTSSLSVDRDGNREFDEIKTNLSKNIKSQLKAIAFFSAKSCIEKKMHLRPDPNPNGKNNPYHALIDDSKNIQGISRANAKYLASICKFKLIN